MYNYAPSLKEFVCSIPICQSEADLGNMLSIFQHLNCKMLAIPQAGLGWGVIRAEDILSLVAKIWLGDCLALTSHPRNIKHQQNMTCQSIPDVSSLIKPVMVYQEDTHVDDFLNCLQHGTLLSEERVYLIVNQQGELQGRVDRDKIIEYLALKSSLRQEVVNKADSTYLNLADLVRAIPLPSRIETTAGELVCRNQLWQQLVIEHQYVTSKFVTLASTETNIDQLSHQWSSVQKPPFSPNQRQDNHEHEGYSDLDEELDRPGDVNFNRQNDLEIERSQVTDWNYLKIPLKGDPRQTAVLKSYYLVLATPNPPPQGSDANSPTANSEVETNQILATVSHELKSPLTGIVGLSTLLKGQNLGSLNQRQTSYVELIYRSGKKMMSVVDDLLQFTSLTVNRPQKLELINLEFLCRQLYQEALIKVRSTEKESDSVTNFSQPKLNIERGSEIALADKSLLSSILFHLMLEIMVADESSGTFEPLKIQLKSISRRTTIIITSQVRSFMSNVGLNLMIAEYLSRLLPANLTHACAANSSQFILTLPKNKIQSRPAADSVVAKSSASTRNTTSNLTILCLYPELEAIDSQANYDHDSNFDLKHWSDNYGLQGGGYQHRIIEADSLEQAHNLARIWRLDAIILNGYQIAQPRLYLKMLQGSEHLATLPLITLDTRTTEAANQIEGLNVYPCLLPSQQRSIEDLIQVIQIAIEH